MGCVASSPLDSDVVLQCKERNRLIKNAVRCRQDFAMAHEAYIQSLRSVGFALRRLSEGQVSPDSSLGSHGSPVLPLPERSCTCSPEIHEPLSPPPSGMATLALTDGLNKNAESSTGHSSSGSPTSSSVLNSPTFSRYSHSIEKSSPVNASPRIRSAGSPAQENVSEGYLMSFSSSPRSKKAPPPMPSPSDSNSWFMYDIFDAPPIPFNLLEQRRRKQAGGAQEDEEDEQSKFGEPVVAEDVNPHVEVEEKTNANETVHYEEAVVFEEQRRSDDKDGSDDNYDAEENVVLDKEDKVEHAKTEKVDTEDEEEEGAGGGGGNTTVELSPDVELSGEKTVDGAHSQESPEKELAIVTSSSPKDLVGAVRDIHDHFARAWRSGKDVSSMLETNMVSQQLDFLDSKDSSKVFNAITLHWSRKASMAVRDACQENDIPECGMLGSHALTLERLCAWERKLYEEVKAGELIRVVFDRKCQQLHYLDTKGSDTNAIDKMRVTVKKLDTRLVVALRAIHLASSKIQKLTNEELYPQLAELLDGLVQMWKVMCECHKAQQAIASGMQTLDSSNLGDEAHEEHARAIIELEHELLKWQIHFQRWINSQKNYIGTLHSWLSKCHIEPEKDKRGRPIAPHLSEKPAIFFVLKNWCDKLESLQREQKVVDAISNFTVVVHSLKADHMSYLRHADVPALTAPEKKYLEYKEEDTNGAIGTSASSEPAPQLKRAASRQKSIDKHRYHDVVRERKEVILFRFKEHLPTVFESMSVFAKDALNVYEALYQPSLFQVKRIGDSERKLED